MDTYTKAVNALNDAFALWELGGLSWAEYTRIKRRILRVL